MISRILGLAILCAVTVGCVTSPTGRKFEEVEIVPSDSSTLYVFRASRFTGFLVVATLTLDGAESVKLGNGTYFVRRLEPGLHTLEIEKSGYHQGSEDELELNAEAGKAYFVEYFHETDYNKPIGPMIFLITVGLRLVPSGIAQETMQGLSEVE